MKTQNQMQDELRKSFTIYMVLLFYLAIQGTCVVNWLDEGQIQTNRIAVLSGPSLANNNTIIPTFTRTYSLTPTVSPSGAAVGIAQFHIPGQSNFSISIVKTLTAANLQMQVKIGSGSVFFKLSIYYIVMYNGGLVFQVISDSLNCTNISTGIGYRSEDILLTPTGSFFSTKNLSCILTIEQIQHSNINGTYAYFNYLIAIPAANKVAITFYTYELNRIYYVYFSLLFYNLNQALKTTRSIFVLGKYSFKDTSDSVFLSNIQLRYIGSNRIFWGMSSFNISIYQQKNFILDQPGSFAAYYISSSISFLTLEYYMFIYRDCNPSTYFYYSSSRSTDDCLPNCNVKPDRPNNDNTDLQCLSCHFSCQTCSGTTSSTCATCPSTRTISGVAPSSCLCNNNYIQIGSKQCSLCSSFLTGCLSCSSTSVCSSCIAGFTGPPPSCSCAGNIVFGYCTMIKGCIQVSVINGTQTCVACNDTLLYELTASFGCGCTFGSNMLVNGSCINICGDGFVLPSQGCDDANNINGDGCDSSCNVETYWMCKGVLSQGSTCKINVTIGIVALGVERVTTDNKAISYFKLTPYFKQMNMMSYNNLFATSLSGVTSSLSFVSSNSQSAIFSAQLSYSDDIEGSVNTFYLKLKDTPYFWYDSNKSTITMKGQNCELTYDDALWIHNVLSFSFIVIIIIVDIVVIISIFHQKWIGLELIQTYQSVFFLFSLMTSYPFQFSPLMESLRYSNGYDDIFSSNFQRIYTLSHNLVAIGIQKQFISNFNVMYILIVLSIIIMVIVSFRRRHLKNLLQQQISQKTTQKLIKTQKIYNFIFSKIFMMIVFYTMFKVIFSFCIQLSNQQSVLQFFPDQLNVVFGMIAFVLVFSLISYILYWYLLLPQNFTEQQQFMSLSFQNMHFIYPLVYLVYQTIFILIISIIYNRDYSTYLLLVVQILYLVYIISKPPYNTLKRINKTLHNANIIFNQVTIIFMTVIVIRWNNVVGTSYQNQSDKELTFYTFLIVFFLFLSLVLAILRILIFNKQVSLKCFKKDNIDLQEINYQQMKKIQKADDYISNKEQIIDLYKQKLTNEGADYSRKQTKNQIALNNYQRKNTNQSDSKNKKKNQVQQFPIDQSKIDTYFNDKYIVFDKKKSTNTKPNPNAGSNIKKTSSKKKAEIIQNAVEMYLLSKTKKEKPIQQLQNIDQQRFSN